MGYLDSKGLERAAWVTKNYAAQNWQMTKASGSNIFCPAPQTELEPIVDFLFAETSLTEGEKSPINPTTINGTSYIYVTRSGKNLLNIASLGTTTSTSGNVTYISNEDGSLTITGSSSNNLYKYLRQNLHLPAGEQLWLSIKEGPKNAYAQLALQLVAYNSDGSEKQIIWYRLNAIPRAIIIPEADHYAIRLYFQAGLNVGETGVTITPMAELKTLSNEWQKYVDLASYGISLGGTYYGGSLNVKTGELTVTHTCVSFDGTETWDSISGYNSTTGLGYTRGYPVAKDPNHRRAYEWFKEFSIGNASINDGLYSCSHFPIIGMFGPTAIENSTITKPCMWYTGTNGDHTLDGQCRFAVPFSDISDFKAWLAQQNTAGTPLTVVYRINEPYIVQLTPQQILSLPQEDKYTPRINTVYTDQKSVRVGYKRLDCIELRSDQTVHGEKTFADSPLVPNPDDLDSQQAAPISFVKDMLRAEVEAMSGGKNTIIRDQWNNPHVMVRIPKFLLKDIDSSWPNEPHPAFIVNGVQKSEIFIGKYLASKSGSNRVQTFPRQVPWTQINFDDSLTACHALGPGFCLNTNAMWAARALWLWKTLGGNHEYLGNRNDGRDYTYHELTGTMKDSSYIPGDTGLTDAATLTGTGGIKWNDDETAYGIADLVGNVWEWVAGFRTNNGEIQIIQNNNASLSTCDMSASSTEWKAVLQDGSLVTPGTADTLKIDSVAADTSTNVYVGISRLNTSITNSINVGYNTIIFKNLAAVSGVTIPTILKQLALFPVSNDLQGFMQSRNVGERLAFRGGMWHSENDGPFALHINVARTHAHHHYGFRTAYIA